MKKHLSLMLILLIGTCLMAQTPVQPSGSGTEGDPYLVETLSHLLWISSASGYVQQQNDIDASETSTWNSDGVGGFFGWDPIDYSTRDVYFDGQGYKIDGLYINRTGENYVGLFGSISGATTGSITNVHLTNANITGAESTGGIVGLANTYNISKCSVAGSVTGTQYVGGIAGRYSGSYGVPVTMEECYNTASVSGWFYMGGLIGESLGATGGAANISDCYAHGSVNALAPTASAGLIGNIIKSAILFSYSKASVPTGFGLIGSTDASGEGGSTVNFSYWDTETSGQATSADGTGYTTSQMQTQSNYIAWDFASTWTIDSGLNDGYPYLQLNPSEDALPITLEKFAAVYEKGSVLLSWRTESETDNARFLIYRDGEVIASIDGAGTSSEPHDYVYADTDVMPGKCYTYILADVSLANQLTIHNDHALTITIEEQVISERFTLGSNYPNPFNPVTLIPFSLNKSGHVNLAIYDINGKLVKTLANGEFTSGEHEIRWNGTNNAGDHVESGMYIARVTVGETTDCVKMLMMK